MKCFTSPRKYDEMDFIMKAEPVIDENHEFSDGAKAELVVWRVPKPLAGSSHAFKYRLAYMERKVCVIRYDNEAGKGDHKHIGRRETEYQFSDLETLLVDFWTAVDAWRKKS